MKTSTAADYHERILRTLLHIQAHLDDALDLDDLAHVACFSPYHFHRVFRGLVGEPVQEHVRRLRLERAAHRLKLQDEAVTKLAWDAGYESHEAFTRAFHNIFGMPPSQFRAAHQGAPDSPSGVHYDDASGYHPPDYGAQVGLTGPGGCGGPGRAGELLDQAPGDARGEQCVARGDDPDGVQQVARQRALEQESARPGAQCRVDVLIEVESGQDEHAHASGRGRSGDLAGGLDAVHDRHA